MSSVRHARAQAADRHTRSRRGRPWDDSSIEHALAELLGDREDWPTYEEFVQASAKGLRDAIGYRGGPGYWARRMGVKNGDRRPGGVRRWTDEAIRAALAGFFGDRPDWPTQREFDKAGLHALREALRHYGGPERWARELGVTLAPDAPRSTARPRRAPPRPPAATRKWPRWEEPRIASELRDFLEGRSEWPRHAEFIEAGKKGLYNAVLTHGGTKHWAKRSGVRWVKRQGLPRYWTDERIREQLAVFLKGRTHWPTRSEFLTADQRGLADAISRAGGVQRWAREFELPRAPCARRAGAARQREGAVNSGTSTARRWDDERIQTAISPLVAELGRWPTKSEFHRAGLRSALSAVYDHGGSKRWRRKLRVRAKRHTTPVPDRRRWSEERIEAELLKLCRGRTSWPSRNEFTTNGANGLYGALSRHGGVAHWRDRLGLD